MMVRSWGLLVVKLSNWQIPNPNPKSNNQKVMMSSIKRDWPSLDYLKTEIPSDYDLLSQNYVWTTVQKKPNEVNGTMIECILKLPLIHSMMVS